MMRCLVLIVALSMGVLFCAPAMATTPAKTEYWFGVQKQIRRGNTSVSSKTFLAFKRTLSHGGTRVSEMLVRGSARTETFNYRALDGSGRLWSMNDTKRSFMGTHEVVSGGRTSWKRWSQRVVLLKHKMLIVGYGERKGRYMLGGKRLFAAGTYLLGSFEERYWQVTKKQFDVVVSRKASAQAMRRVGFGVVPPALANMTPSSWLYRLHFAHVNRPKTTKKAIPTSSVFPLKIIALTGDKVGIPNARVLLNDKQIGKTDKFGTFVGAFAGRPGTWIKISVVGKGKRNQVNVRTKLRMKRVANGGYVPSEVKVEVFLRPSMPTLPR